MADARILIAFAALLCMALFYRRWGVAGAFAPLCAVATVALGLSLFGALGLLRLGGWLLYAFAALCAGFLLWEGIARKKAPPAPGPGFWFFAAAGLVFIGLLWAKQPLFTDWDEFSLWGTAAKLMKLDNQLYTTAPVGWAWTPTQKPAYIVFGYFFQFFGSEFAEWQTYAACDIFQMALLAALMAPFAGRMRQNWATALPLGAVALLLPYVFLHYRTAAAVSPAYLSTLVDVPLGLCFGAALIAGLWAGGPLAGAGTSAASAPLTEKPGASTAVYGAPASADPPRARAALPAALPAVAALALLTMMKETGFALALVAAVIAGANAFLARPAGMGNARRKGWLPALGLLGALLLAVLAPFALWNSYTTAVSGHSQLESAVTTGGVGLLGMPGAFIKDWLARPHSPRFEAVTTGMFQQFLHSHGNMMGTGLVVALLCLGLVGLSALLYRDKTHRRQAAALALLSALGFVAYYLLITMTYLYVLRQEQALESYERYVFPYYIGWLMAALAFFAWGVARSASRLVPLARLGVLAFAAALFLKTALLVPVGYTIFGVNPQEYNARRAFNAKADAVARQLPADSRTFLVLSDDLGIGWFMYCHQLLPLQLDYSYGGGELLQRQPGPGGTTLKIPVTAAMLADHLLKTRCTNLYIDNADGLFVDTYAPLFADHLSAYLQGATQMYRVAAQDGTVTLHPVYPDAAEKDVS